MSSNDPLKKWSQALTVTVRAGNRVDYLIDGWAAFSAMHEAIHTTFSKDAAGAYYIYLLGWYLDDDVPLIKGGLSFRELCELTSRQYGVQIRAMLWDQLGLQNNAAVRHFNALPTGAAIKDNETLWPNVGSHHQKVLIVKGQRGLIGFCGGVDINSDRVEEEGKGSPLHDVHCRIAGSAVRDLVNVFVQRWQAHSASEKIDEPKERGGKGPLLGLCDQSQRDKEEAKGEQGVAIARTFNLVGDGQRCAKDRSIKDSLTRLISTAKRFIYIEDQYLWNFDAARLLGQALSHLQHVTILITHTDLVKSVAVPDGGRWAHMFFMQTLLGAAEKEVRNRVRVFYRVTPGTVDLGPKSYVHSKVWIFDDELALIGSANCNRRGWESDSEVFAAIVDQSANVRSPSFAQTLRSKLWEDNLGIPATNLLDGVQAASNWPSTDSPPKAGCRVRQYDLIEEAADGYPLMASLSPDDPGLAQARDMELTRRMWDKIDPGDGGLCKCGSNSTVSQPERVPVGVSQGV